MVHIINKEDSVYNRFLAELRDKEIQKDPLRFRRNLERVGEVVFKDGEETLMKVIRAGNYTYGHRVVTKPYPVAPNAE